MQSVMLKQKNSSQLRMGSDEPLEKYGQPEHKPGSPLYFQEVNSIHSFNQRKQTFLPKTISV